MPANEEIRFMWVMVLFDLPVGTDLERKRASGFRLNLIKDGYTMVQFSIYARPCRGNESAEKHLKRLEKFLPGKGSVRALKITDKQYSKMKIFLGDFSKNEIFGTKQLCFF